MIFAITSYCSFTINYYLSISNNRTISTICICNICTLGRRILIYPNITISLTIVDMKNNRVPISIPSMVINQIRICSIINYYSIPSRNRKTISNPRNESISICSTKDSYSIRIISRSIPSISFKFHLNPIVTWTYCSYILFPLCHCRIRMSWTAIQMQLSCWINFGYSSILIFIYPTN